jgi:hypothetical protein
VRSSWCSKASVIHDCPTGTTAATAYYRAPSIGST